MNPYASRRRNLKPDEDVGDPSTTEDSRGIAIDEKGSDRVESDALPRSAAASEPNDADLERGILDALAKGLDGVARSLSAQLDDRRRARAPDNVRSIGDARPRRRS